MVLIYPRDLLYIYISKRKKGIDAMRLKRGEEPWVEYRIRRWGVKTIEDIQFSTGTLACLFDHYELIYFKIDKNWTN